MTTYLTREIYDDMLNQILGPAPSLDPRSDLVELLGNVGDIWTDTCLIGADPAEVAQAAIDRITDLMTPAQASALQPILDQYRELSIVLFTAMIKLVEDAHAPRATA